MTVTIKLPADSLLEMRRLNDLATRTRYIAELLIALTQMADTNLHSFLEGASGTTLPEGSYQLDAENGYLLPVSGRKAKAVATPPESPEPIDLKSRKKK